MTFYVEFQYLAEITKKCAVAEKIHTYRVSLASRQWMVESFSKHNIIITGIVFLLRRQICYPYADRKEHCIGNYLESIDICDCNALHQKSYGWLNSILGFHCYDISWIIIAKYTLKFYLLGKTFEYNQMFFYVYQSHIWK